MASIQDLSAEISSEILRHWTEPAQQDRLAHLVLHLARGFRRSLEYRLAAHDVPYGSWIFLRVLWREDGLSQRDLAVRAGVTEPTVHAALARLEDRGLIARRPPAKGRRRLHAYLTEAGRALEDVLVPLAEEANAVALGDIPEENTAIVRSALIQMVRNLAADEAEMLASGRTIAPTRGER